MQVFSDVVVAGAWRRTVCHGINRKSLFN